MSHDEGSSDAKKSSDRAPSLNDTVPGVPDIQLGRTLQTGAAFHATAVTYPIPASPMPNTPASLPRHDPATAGPTSSSPPDAERASSPPSGTGGPLTFGTTRQEFTAAPKVSAREKAKRNVLTHTLQMPMTVTPLPPAAASPSHASSSSKPDSRRATIKGTQPPGVSLPAGWTTMQRVGSSPPPAEYSSSRPAPHKTERTHAPQERGDRSERFERTERADRSERFERTERSDPSERFARAEPVADRRPEPRHSNPTLQDQPFSWQNPPPSGQEMPRWSDRAHMPEYDRTTVPGSPVRIPALSTREWLFIALLACASAATLYSLLIDDVTTPVEEESESATGSAAEHVVTPAPLPDPQKAAPGGETKAAAPLAASANVTEIVSEPAHAEIVVGGAVIGNTPAQVVRGDQDADYLLRKAGYEPQLVRVTPHSPKSITITLHAKP